MNKNILEDGYYAGKVEELQIDSLEFDTTIDFIKTLYNKKDEHYTYRHSCDESANLPHRISMQEKEERIKFVEDNNIDVWQQWAELSVRTEEIQHHIERLRKIWIDRLPQIYPELNETNIHFMDSITLYENGDFINWHYDGTQKGRVCAVLMYLSDRSEYNDGGGKFMIQNEKIGKYQEVLPIKKNFVLLDFKYHNLKHAVEKVKNDFKRYCYLAFVYNKNIME